MRKGENNALKSTMRKFNGFLYDTKLVTFAQGIIQAVESSLVIFIVNLFHDPS